MDLKKGKLQSIWKMNKEKLIFLFCSGLLLFVLAIPSEGEKAGDKAGGLAPAALSGGSLGIGSSTGGSLGGSNGIGSSTSGSLMDEGDAAYAGDAGNAGNAAYAGITRETAGTSFGSAGGSETYEAELERRIQEILAGVDGVGEVDVMVVLKSSEEKVIHVDKSTTSSATEEKGEGGTSRTVRQQELSESTVMNGQSQAPVIEKELSPEVSGIIISADGGGSAAIKAEISEAMEALFGLPAHKIKVLKRVKKGV